MFSNILKRKKIKKFYILLTVCFFCFLILVQTSCANEIENPPLPKCELPLIVTTAGQSPGAMSISVISRRSKIDNDMLPLAKAEDLITKEYKTLIITMGTSGKGMGAAGIDITDELIRIERLIEEAKKQNIFILGFHIEGEARRTGHCEDSIDLVAPRVDYLVVRSDGNKDGRFNEIAQKYEIPLRIFEESIELVDLLKEIFPIKND